MSRKISLSKIPIRYFLLGGISLITIIFIYVIGLFISFYAFNKNAIEVYKLTNKINKEITIIDNQVKTIFADPYRYIQEKEYKKIYKSLNRISEYIHELSKFNLINNNFYFKQLQNNFETYKNKLAEAQNLNNQLYNNTDSRLAVIRNLVFQLKNNPEYLNPPFNKYVNQIVSISENLTSSNSINIQRKLKKLSKQLELQPVSSPRQQIVKKNLLATINNIKLSIADYYYLLDRYGEPFSSGVLKAINPANLQASIVQLLESEENIIVQKSKKRETIILLAIGLFALLLIFYGYNVYKIIYQNLYKILQYLKRIEYGSLEKFDLIRITKELSDITITINRITSNLRFKNRKLQELAKGNYDIDISPLSSEDVLTFSIIDLKNYLKKYHEDIQKTRENEEKQKWVTQGLAHLSDVLRKYSTELNSLLENSLKELLKTLNAPMGAIYYRENKADEVVYKLNIAFAYNKKKVSNLEYRLTEGFIGTVAADAKPIIISPVPENYIFYETAFGYGRPNTIAWFPIQFENEIYGILEIASNEKFEDYHISFIEKFTNDLGTTINYVLINERTRQLVKELTQKTEDFEQKEIEYKLRLEDYNEKINDLKEEIKQLKLDNSIKQNIISEKVAQILELEQKIKEKDKELKETIARFKKAEKAYQKKIENLEDQIQKLIDKYEK